MSGLKTSAEIAMERAPGHPVPPITDPLGQHWRQPSRFDIEIDDKHALMTQRSFDELHEYSASLPTGKYPGKMWRLQRPWRAGGNWFLAWYGEIDGDDILIHYRQILIV